MSNTIASVAPILIREGLLAFRENAIMPRLMAFDLDDGFSEKGKQVSVSIGSPMTASTVSNASTNNATQDLGPTTVDVTLDHWYESKFALSDKQIQEIRPDFLPQQASEAIKALCNTVDAKCLALYKDIAGHTGVAGTAPASKSDIAGARKILNDQIAPLDNRVLLMNTATEASFLGKNVFTSVEQMGDNKALRDASLGRLLGFDTYIDQNMPSHTTGTLAAANSIASKAIAAVAATTLTLDDSAGGTMIGTLNVGDCFKFAGDTQGYTITTAATAATNEVVIVFAPGLKSATANGTVLTLAATHGVNLGFNRNAFAFASRKLEVQSGLGSIIESLTDPLSGISLRLEITRRAKQTVWSYDILFGCKTVYRDLAMRLLS
jgi:P22 coat protein - gene protein 5